MALYVHENQKTIEEVLELELYKRRSKSKEILEVGHNLGSL